MNVDMIKTEGLIEEQANRTSCGRGDEDGKVPAKTISLGTTAAGSSSKNSLSNLSSSEGTRSTGASASKTDNQNNFQLYTDSRKQEEFQENGVKKGIKSVSSVVNMRQALQEQQPKSAAKSSISKGSNRSAVVTQQKNIRNLLLKHPQNSNANSAASSINSSQKTSKTTGGSQRASNTTTFHEKSNFKKQSSFASQQGGSSSQKGAAGGDCSINNANNNLSGSSRGAQAYLKADSKKYIQNLKQTGQQSNNNFGANQSHTLQQSTYAYASRVRASSSETKHVQQKLLMGDPAPYVSATSWIILDRRKGELLFGKCETEQRQVASLTKIMTAHTVLNIIDQMGSACVYASLGASIRILGPVSAIIGTTANLRERDELTVEQLMYGMMLPSGNDAATALAIHFGGILMHKGLKSPCIEITDDDIARRLAVLKHLAALKYQYKIKRQQELDQLELIREQQELLLAQQQQLQEKASNDNENDSSLPTNEAADGEEFKQMEEQSRGSNGMVFNKSMEKKQLFCGRSIQTTKLQSGVQNENTPTFCNSSQSNSSYNKINEEQMSSSDYSSSQASKRTAQQYTAELNLKMSLNSLGQTVPSKFQIRANSPRPYRNRIDLLDQSGNGSYPQEPLSSDIPSKYNSSLKSQLLLAENNSSAINNTYTNVTNNLSFCQQNGQNSQLQHPSSFSSRLKVDLDPTFQCVHMTPHQVEIFYQNETIPTPASYELPRDFYEQSEKKRAFNQLLNEKIDEQLGYFYEEMNKNALNYGMKRTNFAVSHGMHHPNNYSCALDMARLSRTAMQTHQFFRDVVNTKTYSVRSRVFSNHVYEWKNTNFLLWNEDGAGTYSGVKTGVTPTAGPCLSVSFKSRDGVFDLIVLVLNCKTREARFTEIPKLISWATSKITKVKKSNLRPQQKRRILRNMAHV